MERKIGEVFEYNGEWYQCVVATNGCRECSLRTHDYCTHHLECLSDTRSDTTSVIFKKLEKVGEPYEKRVSDGAFSTFQRYKKVYNSVILPKKPYMYYNSIDGTIEIEIKQNKEDMEEKKGDYDGNMDKECIPLCNALNSLPDVHTTESCCGHCKDRFMIFFTCNNPYSLAIIARVFDRRYINTSQLWYIELQTKDSGAYDYFVHSETKYNSEEVMMKDINQIIENIKYWSDDKFALHFKGCDDKPTLAPFDINLAKQGKPVYTRDGRKARIICFDRLCCDETSTIVACVFSKDGKDENVIIYSSDGFIADKQHPYDDDLMMLPEKHEGWVNVYKGGLLDTKAYDTKKDAFDKASPKDYIATVKIEWEE